MAHTLSDAAVALLVEAQGKHGDIKRAQRLGRELAGLDLASPFLDREVGKRLILYGIIRRLSNPRTAIVTDMVRRGEFGTAEDWSTLSD